MTRPWRRCSALVTVALLAMLGCEQRGAKGSRSRSDAVSSASREMSGPALFSNETLAPALQALRAKADGKVLRLEIRAREIVLQGEDTSSPGGVLELHYRDGQVGEPEHAALRGKGQLADNLFELDEVKLDNMTQLTQGAVQRIDDDSGSVDLVLIRRNLPDSDDVRVRVYVSSPRKSGYVDLDAQGNAL